MRSTEPAPLSAAATLADGPTVTRGEAGVPARLGRYLVLGELGRGGMGAVYLAYDPELDRKVAVKLLDAPDGDPAQQDRLLREAQAMARLAHPNVAAVFDVGVLGRQVYLAMEYVEGASLRAWLAAGRPWPAIVATYVQAGRGLAAAHAAGLVHRDFKPENAIVGRDGRVRVLDFGLAALGAEAPTDADAAPSTLTSLSLPGLASRSLLSSRLTAAGAIVGTLAYMSPEQLTLAELDPRSDQFGFCVALHEALHGELPFAGDTAGAYALAVTSGAVRAPPRGPVPRWLDRVLARGLAPAREDRWPDMDSLLAALSRDPAANRRRLALISAAIAASVGLGLVVGRRSGEQGGQPCRGTDAPIAAVWSPDVRARVEAAFTATRLPYAADTLAAALPRVDAWVARWSAASRSLCLAHRAGEVSDALHDREVTCLSGQVHGLAARARLLAAADADAVTHAITAVEALPDPEACRDPALLAASADPDAAARVREVDAEQAFGHYVRARELAAAAVAAAPGDGDLADALHAEGEVLYALGQPHASRTSLVRAFARAAAVGRRDRAFAAATMLLQIAADEFRDLEEAALWRDLAVDLASGAALDRLVTNAGLPVALGAFAAARGDHDEALAHIGRADAWTLAELGPDSLLRADILLEGTRVLRLAGRYAEAEAGLLRVRATYDRVLGPAHPQQAALANNLGVLYGTLDRDDEALRELERARSIVGAIEGPSSVHLASIDSNLIMPYGAVGRHDEAIAAARAALEMFEREVGPETARVAIATNNLGHALQNARRCAEARPAFERSLAISQKIAALPPDISAPLYNLAACALQLREFPAALDYADRSLAALATLPESHEHDHVRLMQARALVGLGRHREAAALLEPLLARWSKDPPNPDRRGDARFVLAEALWAGKLDRRRALAEARVARDLQRDARSPHFSAAEIDAWLAARAR